jgi:sugar phosphate isomerase/epimerase
MHTTNFSLGITYWPRRSGYGWWRAFDRGETRDDMAQVAGLGCDTVRFCLRWEDFQPEPRRLNSAALRDFERALDLAGDAGLRVAAVLFPVAIGGQLALPAWASRPDPVDLMRLILGEAAGVRPPVRLNGERPAGLHPIDTPPVIYGDAYHASNAPNLFTDSRLRQAQRYLISEVVGYFASHPALLGWQLGEGLERLHAPASAAAAQEWIEELAALARECGGVAIGFGATRSLLHPAGPRPEHLAVACDLAGLTLDTPLPLPEAGPLAPESVTFAYRLAAGLAGQPLLLAGLGAPTAPERETGWVETDCYGRTTRVYRAAPQEQAEFLADAIRQLWQAGARGVWLTDYADYPPDQWALPPLDRSVAARTRGLVDAAGREKPAAGALRELAATLRGQEQPMPAPFEVDAERYWRDPRAALTRLWRDA